MTVQANFEFEAHLRQAHGKSANRKLRREQDQIPAIIYGGDDQPLSILLDHKKMLHMLENKAIASHVLTLSLDGAKQPVVLKQVHRHHYKKALLHVDFQRVRATDKLHLTIPLKFVGELLAPGVKKGGVFTHQAVSVEVRCLASALPEFIEVDLSQLDAEENFHLSDLKLPPGVELIALAQGMEHDLPVASCRVPRVAVETASTETAAAASEPAPAK